MPALDDPKSDAGAANYNNGTYLKISPLFLSASLSYIRAEPATYAGDVQRAIQVWLLPSDQYFEFPSNYPHVSGYARLFDTALFVQPEDPGPSAGIKASTVRHPPSVASESWTLIVMMLVLLFATPVMLFRLRRSDPSSAYVGLVMWVTVVYAFGITSLVSLGENNRFRFELGPLPVVLVVLVVFAIGREMRARRGQPVTVT